MGDLQLFLNFPLKYKVMDFNPTGLIQGHSVRDLSEESMVGKENAVTDPLPLFFGSPWGSCTPSGTMSPSNLPSIPATPREGFPGSKCPDIQVGNGVDALEKRLGPGSVPHLDHDVSPHAASACVRVMMGSNIPGAQAKLARVKRLVWVFRSWSRTSGGQGLGTR